jgi:antitoxin YefM
MQVISYSEARNSLKSVLDSVNDNADVTIINRRDAGNAVVMSLDHYNSIMETLYLMQSPANAAHLMESIAQFKTSKATVKQLIKD